MGAEKLSISLDSESISLDSELAASVRAAASEQDVSVSTWLADAAQAQVRQLRLREALDVLASEEGKLGDQTVRAFLERAGRTGVDVRTTSGAVAQVWRNGVR